MNYLNQRAAPWVSIVVMTGGIFIAFGLIFLFKAEAASYFISTEF